jgi:hypothetical protein
MKIAPEDVLTGVAVLLLAIAALGFIHIVHGGTW